MNDWKQKLQRRLPVLILLTATVLFWSLYDRYEPAGPVLLQSPDLEKATILHGDVSETEGRIRLHVPATDQPASVYFPVPAATDHGRVRLRIGVATEGVRVGLKSWYRARAIYVQRDAGNRWILGKHVVLAEKDSKAWKPYEVVFKTHPDAVRAEVVLQQLGPTGTAWFGDLEVQPVAFRASFGAWRILFAGLWILVAALIFTRCRPHRHPLKILILLNVIAILAGALVPSTWIDTSAVVVKDTLLAARAQAPVAGTQPPPGEPAPPRERIDENQELATHTHQAGHMALFASLCLLVYLSALLEKKQPRSFSRLTVDILLFAAVTESLQFLTLDRSANLSDLLVDVLGIAAAILLFLAARPLLRRVFA